jgi:hypothetical protein
MTILNHLEKVHREL